MDQNTGKISEEGFNMKIDHIKRNILEFSESNYAGLFLTLGVFFSLVQRFMFNHMADFPLPFDNWKIFDILCLLMNIVCFSGTSTLTHEYIMDEGYKRNIDYIVVVTIVL